MPCTVPVLGIVFLFSVERIVLERIVLISCLIDVGGFGKKMFSDRRRKGIEE